MVSEEFPIESILMSVFSGDIREDYGIHRVEGTFWILDQSMARLNQALHEPFSI